MTETTVQQYEVATIRLGPFSGDPWAQVDVEFGAPDGSTRTVPAFAQDGRWQVRYASGSVGVHTWQGADASGTLRVDARTDRATRLSHGPLRIAGDQRHLEHADGTPFLWLADTWWFGFATNKSSDAEFAEIAALRNEQGFSVVQIVAGLPCEVEPFARAGGSRTGWAWHDGFNEINLAWWDDADVRMRALLDNDLVPCVLGSWGFHLGMMSKRQLTRHWREMIARWGAYPVVWCVSGEPSMPWYDELATALQAGAPEGGEAETLEAVAAVFESLHSAVEPQLTMFNRMTRAISDLDPFDRLLTAHSVGPQQFPKPFIEEPELLDFWLWQSGHHSFNGLTPAIDLLEDSLSREPAKPCINGEPSYEGIAGSSHPDIQRFQFWSHMLSGAAGHSYGAHGLWAFNTDEFPGQYSGLAPRWQEAARFPGAAQIGVGARLLASYPWEHLVPDPELVDPHQKPGARLKPYAARLPDGRRLIYFPSVAMNNGPGSALLKGLGTIPWTARCLDPVTGELGGEIVVHAEEDGTARLLFPPYGGMWPFPSWGDWIVELTPRPAEKERVS